MNSTKIHYFDYNATHPPFQEILTNSLDNYLNNFYNPSGPTRFSLSRQATIEKSRSYFSSIINKSKDSIVFSSSGTESNYLLVKCIKEEFKVDKIITSPFEHSSIYGALEDFGIEPIILKTDKSGIINLNHLEDILKNQKIPILVIYAANETGVIQPILDISNLAKTYQVPFYSDLMQAFCKTVIQFSLLDGFTFSSHKIGGGMGASLTSHPILYKTEISLFKGGNQENTHRAGTENSMAISSFVDATEYHLALLIEKNLKLKEFRHQIENYLENLGFEIIAKNSNRLLNTTFALLPIDDVDFFMIGLEEKNIIISNGSSCKSRSREASKSLLSMGYSKEIALRAIRISTGFFTNKEDVDYLLESIQNVMKRLK